MFHHSWDKKKLRVSYKGHLADSGGNGLMYGAATGSGRLSVNNETLNSAMYKNLKGF